MDYEKAWTYLKVRLDDIEKLYEEHMYKSNIEQTYGKLMATKLIQQYMFDIEAENGLFTVKEDKHSF
jgi:hypothetical protein